MRTVVTALVIMLPATACGQTTPSRPSDLPAPAIPREFRAVWVATVDNMDWPSRSGLSTAAQQRELLAILDTLVALRMNAVVLQVRPAADAFYDSKLEPWSSYLTGEMGRAPSPYYDPLAFAITEAHKRGLELHAWINPYRAQYSARRPASQTHISRTNPDLVSQYGPYLWMDPGRAEVRAHTEKVVADLVTRYDLDGIHMDDYFYPYKEIVRGRELDFPDAATYAAYRRGGGALSRDDWRRHNVDQLVQELGGQIHRIKPWVRFGISPFGIWRPGNPPSVRGLDQYTELYADARRWLREGWVDYFTPQLYWAIDRPNQSYPVLLRWWQEQNLHGRHLWPGNYTSKVGMRGSGHWSVDEVIDQIRATRAQEGATGNVHFSMEVFMKNADGLNDRLRRDVYQSPALVPATPWLDRRVPAAPIVTPRSDPSSGDVVLDLALGAGELPPWLWVIRSRSESGWTTEIVPGTAHTRRVAVRGAPLPELHVTAINRVGTSSAETRVLPRR